MWIKVGLRKRKWIQRRERNPRDLLLASMKRRRTSDEGDLKVLSLQMFFSLSLTGLVSILGGIITYSIIPKFRDMFIKVRESTLVLHLLT